MLNLSTLVQMSSQLLIPPGKHKARKHEKYGRAQEAIPQQRIVKLSRYISWGTLLCGIEFPSITDSFILPNSVYMKDMSKISSE